MPRVLRLFSQACLQYSAELLNSGLVMTLGATMNPNLVARKTSSLFPVRWNHLARSSSLSAYKLESSDRQQSLRPRLMGMVWIPYSELSHIVAPNSAARSRTLRRSSVLPTAPYCVIDRPIRPKPKAGTMGPSLPSWRRGTGLVDMLAKKSRNESV